MSTRYPLDPRWDAVEITDNEKNEAVNRIERDLAERARDYAGRKRSAQPTNEMEDDAHARHREKTPGLRNDGLPG
jgi:hypothetical protein